MYKKPNLGQISKLRGRRLVSQYLSNFKENDIVALRGVLKPDKVALSKPLTPGTLWATPHGNFEHDELLGKEPRAVVMNKKGDKFIVTHPTLETYLINRRRDAQPIYPYDAASIVTLADIHVDSLEPGVEAEPLHFLEAGTGHGSLTVAICKAIHAANPKGQPRGAILHSVDRNSNHSKTGRKNVEHFRQGIYLRDVDFHVADSPSMWLKSSGVKLSGVFLDLPSPETNIKQISQYMRVDAPLTVFCPSVSQIQELTNVIAEDPDIPLVQVDVVELMPGMGGSMRGWDVRSARIKETGRTGTVCRPRVGSKVVGGGFVALFRRLPDTARPKPEPAPGRKTWLQTIKSFFWS